MLPLGASGLSGLKEKRKTVVHDLDLSQTAPLIGDFNHTADNALLFDYDAVSHVNNAEDPGSSNITFAQTAGQNIDRPRSITSNVTFGDSAHVAKDGVTPSLTEYNLTANETINIGQPVYISAANTVNLADADTLSTSHVLGLAVTDATANQTVTVLSDGSVERSDWTAVIGTANLTPGVVYYLSTTAGGLTSTPPTGDGDNIVRCGVAVSTTKFDIEINEVAIL